GYTTNEVNEELMIRKEALDRMCSLEILSAIEARLRIDYLVRCQKKKKDELSIKFGTIYKRKEAKASLTDDIFLKWKEVYPVHKKRLDRLGMALDYRNWLAHGRYWQPKNTPHIHRYDFLEIYTLAVDILDNMDLVEPA